MTSGRARLRGLLLIVMLSVFPLGCNPLVHGSSIDDAISAINNSVGALSANSDAWRQELPQLATQLDQIAQKAEGQGNADAKIMIADSSNQVRSLFADTTKTASLSAQEIIADFGTEVRCNTDFFQSRVSDTLQQLKGNLAFWKQEHKLPPSPPHAVCHMNPSTVELHPLGSGSTWSIGFPSNKIVGIYGYNFRSDSLPKIELRDANQQRIRDARITVSYVTRYQINLDFSGEDFHQIALGAGFVLVWPDQPDPNRIEAILDQPAHLKITKVTYAPSAPQAGRDPVLPTVTVVNQGGSDSGLFVMVWTPGSGLPSKSQSLQSLSPGQQLDVHLDGYTYPNGGTFTSVISLSTGSDTHTDTISVTRVEPQRTTQQWSVEEHAGSCGPPGPCDDHSFDERWHAPFGWKIDRSKGDVAHGHAGMDVAVNQSNQQANESLRAYNFGVLDDSTVGVKGTIHGATWWGPGASFSVIFTIYLIQDTP